MFMLMGMLAPLVVLALVVASVRAIWRTVTLPRLVKAGGACERCGYAVADLTSFTCPECGEDLRRVGIITPAMEARRRGSLFAAIAGWTFLCAVVAYAGVMATAVLSIQGVGPTIGTWKQDLTPSSGAYRSLTIEYESDGMSIASELALVLTTADGATYPLTIDPGPMQVYGVGGTVTEWLPDTIETWYAEVGLDTADPAVAAEAAEVSNFIDLLVMSPSSAYRPNLVHHQIQRASTGGIGVREPPGGFFLLPAALGVLGVIYVVGLVLIVRRRRRMLRSIASFPPAA